MQNKDEEEVLVVKTDILFPEGMWDGFRPIKEKNILATIKKNGTFLKRKFAENDPEWQQIIPQISLIVGKKIFIHRIPSSTNETRLTDMWPIFLGGHVNNFDGEISSAIQREFDEEITYRGKILNKTFLGVVKKTEPLVNKVHTGLVWVYEGDSEVFESTQDNGIADGKFVNLSELDEYIPKMSYWSQIATPFIVEKYNTTKD